MIEKLQIIQQRFDEVSDLIIQPDVITDQKRYIQLNKEYKELSVMVEKMNQYKIIISNLEEAELLLKDEQDEEMIAMAKMEIESAKENLPKLEEEIKFKGVCTDTRKNVTGRLFIALEGENFDGHIFTQNAEELGAKAYSAPEEGLRRAVMRQILLRDRRINFCKICN